ncbi:DUF2934 domain-containing protein [Paraburkholderia fynbosensis]|uniref:Uncharacterized protein n=1 Tax=Paraburkholderia fynbosensis TaxID=1200993 RepID=A0A6J5H4U6_9BURK|nr:DUF2934 domain-containing protein [Paraburkholderia fynbosensis]CAB3808986.1 hypothetical protein LMG27177_06670 [Paraburkholderia fynbosensis]
MDNDSREEKIRLRAYQLWESRLSNRSSIKHLHSLPLPEQAGFFRATLRPVASYPGPCSSANPSSSSDCKSGAAVSRAEGARAVGARLIPIGVARCGVRLSCSTIPHDFPR